jgi:hypothetical protein
MVGSCWPGPAGGARIGTATAVGPMNLPAAEAPTLYTLRLKLAFTAAGRIDSGWNRRFRGALEGLMLEIRQRPHDRDRPDWYPDGGALLAPWPASGPGGWPGDALICWGSAARVAFNSCAINGRRGCTAAAVHNGRGEHVAHPYGDPC